MLKPNLLKKCFTTTLMHRLSQFGASQNSIPNMHEVHTEVKPVCMLSEPSSSLSRQTFAGSQVACTGCSICLEIFIDLILSSHVAKSVHSAKISDPVETALFCIFFLPFSAGYLVIYNSAWLHGAKQTYSIVPPIATGRRLYRSTDAARTRISLRPLQVVLLFLVLRPPAPFRTVPIYEHPSIMNMRRN